MDFSVIIPVYNEERTIAEVLRRVATQDIGEWEKEIIVVDDGSTDSSKLKVQSAKLTIGHPERSEGSRWDSSGALRPQNDEMVLISHKQNLGKGAAIKTGLQQATGDYVLIQDADLEYDPADWPALLEAAEAIPGAAIYGSRNLRPDRRGYRHYVWGVWILTKFTNLLFGSKLTDVYTGYKLIPAALLKSLPLVSSGFEFEAEITAKLLGRGVGIKEVPIHYNPRSFSEGKKIRFRDGLVGLWTILKNRFRQTGSHIRGSLRRRLS